MIPENAVPAIAVMTPPMLLEDAVARIAEYSSGERSLGGLFGVKFSSMDQFRMAMNECGFMSECRLLGTGHGGLNALYSLDVDCKDGARWNMTLNEIAGSMVDVVLAVRTKEAT